MTLGMVSSERATIVQSLPPPPCPCDALPSQPVTASELSRRLPSSVRIARGELSWPSGRDPIRCHAGHRLGGAEERLGGCHVAVLTEQHAHECAGAVDGAIQVAPAPVHFRRSSASRSAMAANKADCRPGRVLLLPGPVAV